jgi:hypothetical protein
MTKAIHNINVSLNPNEEDADTQLVTLINHFSTCGPPLTMASAFLTYGIGALSQRAGQLISMGFPIIKEPIKVTKRNGKVVTVMSYTM